MTPQHFDELVALATPHLPVPARGPSPIYPTYRIFATFFWLAQGGRQRVIARAVDVAESTFSKHCAPVVAALLAGLPKPEWPGAAERQGIGREFAALTIGNASGWSGLYVYMLRAGSASVFDPIVWSLVTHLFVVGGAVGGG